MLLPRYSWCFAGQAETTKKARKHYDSGLFSFDNGTPALGTRDESRTQPRTCYRLLSVVYGRGIAGTQFTPAAP